jgi:Flp pilus assembly protein TadG
VEFALLLPLLLFVVFGLIDFGRMYHEQIILTAAAREGARAAALGLDANSRVQATTSGWTGVTAAVTACPTTGASNVNTTVIVSHTFTFVTPVAAIASLFGGGMGGSRTLTGKGIMPCVK